MPVAERPNVWLDDVVPDWIPGLLAARPSVCKGTPKCVVAVFELRRGGGERLVFWEKALLDGRLLPLADCVKSSVVCPWEARDECATVVKWGGRYGGLRVVGLGTYGRRVVVGGL